MPRVLTLALLPPASAGSSSASTNDTRHIVNETYTVSFVKTPPPLFDYTSFGSS